MSSTLAFATMQMCDCQLSSQMESAPFYILTVTLPISCYRSLAEKTDKHISNIFCLVFVQYFTE